MLMPRPKMPTTRMVNIKMKVKIIMETSTLMLVLMLMIMMKIILKTERVDNTQMVMVNKTTPNNTPHLSASTMALSLILMNMSRSKVLTINHNLALVKALSATDVKDVRIVEDVVTDACPAEELSVTQTWMT